MTAVAAVLKNHELIEDYAFRSIRYETRPVHARDGREVEGLHQVWIWLDNPKQLNAYTTQMVKETILALQRASADRRCVAVVFTGAGEKSFCTGGNTEEYATYYCDRPQEYAQYMRLFNDMITGLLHCDKPVICRVNGLRVGGGQEVGMACDFSIAGDHARFGQAGPVHGSAPDGGATDFLDLYVGYARAAESLVLCDEPWSAHKAMRLNLVNEIVSVYRPGSGDFLPNPLAITDRYIDAQGRIVYGEWKTGPERQAAQESIARCKLDLSLLDAACDRLVTRLLYTFPDCTRKTIESLRKKKLLHWQLNAETNRSWLALNMHTEAAIGFRAFHYADRGEREADFIALRRRLAEGVRWNGELLQEALPPSARAKLQETVHAG